MCFSRNVCGFADYVGSRGWLGRLFAFRYVGLGFNILLQLVGWVFGGFGNVG